jgi:hypothetical protein
MVNTKEYIQTNELMIICCWKLKMLAVYDRLVMHGHVCLTYPHVQRQSGDLVVHVSLSLSLWILVASSWFTILCFSWEIRWSLLRLNALLSLHKPSKLVYVNKEGSSPQNKEGRAVRVWRTAWSPCFLTINTEIDDAIDPAAAGVLPMDVLQW